jgi:hypothetical protein
MVIKRNITIKTNVFIAALAVKKLFVGVVKK